MIPELQEIVDNYKKRNNKELSAIAVHLYNDFNAIKESLLLLTSNMNEIEKVYKIVYSELQERLKFEDKINEEPQLTDEKRDS